MDAFYHSDWSIAAPDLFPLHKSFKALIPQNFDGRHCHSDSLGGMERGRIDKDRAIPGFGADATRHASQ